jgi:hypothetical protein
MLQLALRCSGCRQSVVAEPGLLLKHAPGLAFCLLTNCLAGRLRTSKESMSPELQMAVVYLPVK